MEEKKGGGASEIVNTDTECHPSFFNSSSASSSLLLETHPNTQTPRPLGVQVLSVITKKKKVPLFYSLMAWISMKQQGDT